MPPVAKIYDLEQATAMSAWTGAAPNARLSALFGDRRFSDADQQADPDAPRTRVVKDVLRVGKWKVGQNEDGSPRMWPVSEATLHQICSSFRAARAAGNTFNLCWGHGDPETKLTDARDAIEPIDDLVYDLASGTLWASAYVTPAVAADLKKASRKASVRVVDKWTDGAGNVYSMALLHVAVVDLPVMTGQGSFLDLANSSSNSPKNRKGKTAMDYQTMLDLWTRAFAALGLTMPENVTEETLPIVVDALLASQEGQEPEEEEEEETMPPGTSETLPALTPANGSIPDAALANALKPITDAIKDLSTQVATIKSTGAKDAFSSKLNSLVGSGRINERTRASLEKTGATHAYDLSLLTPFEDLQMIDMGRRGKAMATNKAPKVSTNATGDDGDLTPDEIQARVNDLRFGKRGTVAKK